MSVKQIGERLVELVRAEKYAEAIDELYAEDIVSQEAMGDDAMPARMEGIDAIRKKAEWWGKNHEVHGLEVEGPFPCKDRFAVVLGIDVTAKAGPGAGQRMQMKEICLYTVRDGKIAEEAFFYDTGG
jgi:ketosteroid isomerase-like protein